MSIVWLCDCPACHGYEDYMTADWPAPLSELGWAQIGDRDICDHCLSGDLGCTYWQPRVLPEPSQLELVAHNIWDPVIYQQLEPGTLLKDWNAYTKNRAKFVTFKIKKERNG